MTNIDLANCWAMSLLSIPGKIFNTIILNKIAGEIDSKLSERQFGFQPGRGTTDVIFVLCQILEKASQHNVKMYMHFVHFKLAFDIIQREKLWKILRVLWVKSCIVDIIKELYDGMRCPVAVGGNLRNWFKSELGICQGCILSPTP